MVQSSSRELRYADEDSMIIILLYLQKSVTAASSKGEQKFPKKLYFLHKGFQEVILL
jgi:hypothetical protein